MGKSIGSKGREKDRTPSMTLSEFFESANESAIVQVVLTLEGLAAAFESLKRKRQRALISAGRMHAHFILTFSSTSGLSLSISTIVLADALGTTGHPRSWYLATAPNTSPYFSYSRQLMSPSGKWPRSIWARFERPKDSLTALSSVKIAGLGRE